MKAYKGMDRNMQCRGFQYKIGETYTTDNAVACETGFHACEYPLDVFKYYTPSDSRFFEVEQSGEISNGTDDSNVASSEIKIGAEIGIPGLVKAAVEYVKSRTTTEHADQERATAGNRGAATGNRSANSATGHWSANSSTGYGSDNSATGDFSANSSTGGCSANSATGIRSANSSTGIRSANSTTGTNSTNEGGAASVNVGWGKDNRCRGVIGSYLVLSVWGDWDGDKYPLITAKMVFVDGKSVKADTWYTLDDSGELTEAKM